MVRNADYILDFTNTLDYYVFMANVDPNDPIVIAFLNAAPACKERQVNLHQLPDRFVRSNGGEDPSCKAYCLHRILGNKGKVTIWNVARLVNTPGSKRLAASQNFIALVKQAETVSQNKTIVEFDFLFFQFNFFLRQIASFTDKGKALFQHHIGSALRSLKLAAASSSFLSKSRVCSEALI